MTEQTINCPTCGTPSRPGKKFCGKCGSPLAPVQSTNVEDISIGALSKDAAPLQTTDIVEDGDKSCPRCARLYGSDVKFCKLDGTLLIDASTGPTTVLEQPSIVEDELFNRIAEDSLTEPEILEMEVEVQATISEPEPELSKQDSRIFPIESSTPMFEGKPIEDETDQGAPDIVVYCISCGTAYPSSARFCDQDGTPLGTLDAEVESQEEAEFEVTDFQDVAEFREQGVSTLAKVGIAGVLVAVLFGSVYWLGLFGSSELDSTDDAKASESAKQASGAPGLIGTYKSFIADQDIILTFSGNEPKPLIAAKGTIEYYNRINGGTCSAALIPAQGGGVGGVPDNSVQFRQQKIPGKPACPMDIPVTAKVGDQKGSNSEIVETIDLEWSDPKSKKVLMRGSLIKAAAQ